MISVEFQSELILENFFIPDFDVINAQIFDPPMQKAKVAADNSIIIVPVQLFLNNRCGKDITQVDFFLANNTMQTPLVSFLTDTTAFWFPYDPVNFNYTVMGLGPLAYFGLQTSATALSNGGVYGTLLYYTAKRNGL